jgi:hypothetical protein
MKFKWQFWTGWTFAAVVLTWCVLAYIFMWPPVVRNYWSVHRQTSDVDVCINNLGQIDEAINRWALEHGKHNGDPVTLEELKPYLGGRIPSCNLGGIYSVTVVGTQPTCSIGLTLQGIKFRRSFFYYEFEPPHLCP